MGKGALFADKFLDLMNGVNSDSFSSAESLAQLAIVDRLATECGLCHVARAAEVLDIR